MRKLPFPMFILLIGLAKGQDLATGVKELDVCAIETREVAPHPEGGQINSNGFSFHFGSGIRQKADNSIKFFYRFVSNDNDNALHYNWPVGGLKNVALAPHRQNAICIFGSEEKLPATEGTLYYGRGPDKTPANVYQQPREGVTDRWFKPLALQTAPGGATKHWPGLGSLGLRSPLSRASFSPGGSLQENRSVSTTSLATTYHSTIIVRQPRKLFRIFPLPAAKKSLELHVTFQSTFDQDGNVYNYHHTISRVSNSSPTPFPESLPGLPPVKPETLPSKVPYLGIVPVSWLSIGDSALVQFGKRIDASKLGTKIDILRMPISADASKGFGQRYPVLNKYNGVDRPSTVQPRNKIRILWSVFNLAANEGGDNYRDIKFSSTEAPNLRYGQIVITDGQGRLLVVATVPAWSPE